MFIIDYQIQWQLRHKGNERRTRLKTKRGMFIYHCDHLFFLTGDELATAPTLLKKAQSTFKFDIGYDFNYIVEIFKFMRCTKITINQKNEILLNSDLYTTACHYDITPYLLLAEEYACKNLNTKKIKFIIKYTCIEIEDDIELKLKIYKYVRENAAIFGMKNLTKLFSEKQIKEIAIYQL